jgi:hypothetical protein
MPGQLPPVPQSEFTLQLMATHVPPPVQMLGAPGVVQTAPAFPDPAEHRPDVVPAGHVRPHSSSGSSIVRQAPPGQPVLTTHAAPALFDLKSHTPFPSSFLIASPGLLSGPTASLSSSKLQKPGHLSRPLLGGLSVVPSALTSAAPASLSKYVAVTFGCAAPLYCRNDTPSFAALSRERRRPS